MSKVDPEDIPAGKSTGIPSLDRKTTLLLSASKRRGGRRGGDEDAKVPLNGDGSYPEKGDYTEDDGRNLDLEDPGVDTIRGFAGLAGSVHRALSARKTISRRKSQMSARSRFSGSQEGYTIDEEGQIVVKNGRWRNRQHFQGRDNVDDGSLTRHQLYDAPMPADAMDRVSAYSKSPIRTDFPPGSSAIREKVRSPTTIGFDEEVVEHRYPGAGERGPVVHQAHNAHVRDATYPHRVPMQHTQSEMSEFGARSIAGDSIIDAYSLPTARPPPVHREGSTPSFVRADSRTSAGTGSGSGSGSVSASGSTATGGSVIRGENRSLSHMITDHFVEHGGVSRPSSQPRTGLTVDTSAGNGGNVGNGSAVDRSTSRDRQMSAGSIVSGGRNIFASIRGRPQPDAQQEAEERMGLVGHSAQFAGSHSHSHNSTVQQQQQQRDANRRSSRSGSASGSSDTESLDGVSAGIGLTRYRDDNEQDDSYARRRL